MAKADSEEAVAKTAPPTPPDELARQAIEQADAQRQEFLKQPEAQGGKPGVSRTALATEMTHIPSDLYEVMIDQWGAGMAGQPSYVRGTVLHQDDTPYDLEAAAARAIVRRLSLAEARSAGVSTTQPLTADGLAVDEDLALSGPLNAGLHNWGALGVAVDNSNRPVTVTGPQGPDEDPELSKPTLPGPEGGQPAARPVIVVDGPLSPVEAANEYFGRTEPARPMSAARQRQAARGRR